MGVPAVIPFLPSVADPWISCVVQIRRFCNDAVEEIGIEIEGSSEEQRTDRYAAHKATIFSIFVLERSDSRLVGRVPC